jgi:putative flippase GtrA
MLAVATLVRQLLVAIGVETIIAGSSAHALGIAIGAIVNYLGHRHVTFTR